MLRIREARHPGCVNVCVFGRERGLPKGEYVLESKSSFLAVVEHQLIPARARSVT